MKLRSIAAGAAIAGAIAACGGTHHPEPRRSHHARPVRRTDPTPVALVTAESRNELLVVELRTGAVSRRLALPADPENVAVAGAVAVVVTPAARTVALVSLRTLHVAALLHGFTSPHVAATTPDRRFAYVTDDAAGTVTPIRLTDARVFPSLRIGTGAHHLAFSPAGLAAWVALGETADTVIELDTRNPAHPRIKARWHPPFRVHDVRFSPLGTTVWLSSATSPDVTVVDAHPHAVRLRVPVGPPPQHIAFGPAGAYLTSGYGGLIERVDPISGRILDHARSPYGSFELDANSTYVATSSLLRGTLTIFDPRLHVRRAKRLAPATREVAIAP